MSTAKPAVGVRRIAMIGNFPPRLCGIATFTAHTRQALQTVFRETAVDVIAMNDPGTDHAYPDEVVATINQDNLGDYHAAAALINDSGADVVVVQHEYGIFGGSAGNLLLKLLDRVNAPVVVILHTVLEQPDLDQRAVIEALARRASHIVVMAHRGREMLERVHGIDVDRITVIPHGVPDRPRVDPDSVKPHYGLDGRTVLLTFGLLSPNKGIETMIRAMPEIVATRSDAIYVVLGATHPHLVAHEGERYRESLVALASDLGIGEHVRFVDGFLEEEALLDWLEAADVYVTPYLNRAQITSGTLSYAVALGKPVVSTAYWHAEELLSDGTGILAPFGDSAAFGSIIAGLLADPERLERISERAWLVGRDMVWSRSAAALMALCEDAVASRTVRLQRPARPDYAAIPPSLIGVERMSDGCGMLQHSIFNVPDRDHGYCVDDNCRALMLMHRLDGDLADRADELATVYASFMQFAWNGEKGRFRNFMSYDRRWLEEAGSEDSFGRSVWALGVTASESRRDELRRWARHLFDQVAPTSLPLGSLRTWAFTLLGADAMLEGHPGHALAESLVREMGQRIHRQLRVERREDWTWFEGRLSYDNARIPEALLRAGLRLRNDVMIDDALAALAWLDALQTNERGQFRAVGTDGFFRDYAQPSRFDQQPLEAWATIDAAQCAWLATGENRWRESAWRAYRWYLGDNDLDVPIATPVDGGCFDGLMSDRANLNQGAESVLAFQLASCAIARIGALEVATDQRERARSAGSMAI